MALLTLLAQLLSAAAFAAYGLHCVRFQGMTEEFERFGLARWRTLTGVLQIAGSAGLLVGLRYRPLTVLAAGGLAALMLGGLIVRARTRDRWYTAMPAFSLLLLNGFILVRAIDDVV